LHSGLGLSGGLGAADLEESRDGHPSRPGCRHSVSSTQGYEFGVAEQGLGEALRERTRRAEVIIATKGSLRLDGDRLLRDASRRWLREGIASRLRSLGTDYIDTYQVHWPDLHTAPEETAGALEELAAEG
jgi:aryl-alcohol dehydrogenase-like predicted oxidoreductase